MRQWRGVEDFEVHGDCIYAMLRCEFPKKNYVNYNKYIIYQNYSTYKELAYSVIPHSF